MAPGGCATYSMQRPKLVRLNETSSAMNLRLKTGSGDLRWRNQASIWAQFCVNKICCWSVICVNHMSCIQWRASKRRYRRRDGSCV